MTCHYRPPSLPPPVQPHHVACLAAIYGAAARAGVTPGQALVQPKCYCRWALLLRHSNHRRSIIIICLHKGASAVSGPIHHVEESCHAAGTGPPPYSGQLAASRGPRQPLARRRHAALAHRCPRRHARGQAAGTAAPDRVDGRCSQASPSSLLQVSHHRVDASCTAPVRRGQRLKAASQAVQCAVQKLVNYTAALVGEYKR